jgi:transcriptional regulator with XRE-family HTH domain
MTETTHTQECAGRLRRICLKMSLSQADLARLAGKSRAVISNFLNGKQVPSYQVLRKLGTSLDLDMNWVFFGEGEMTRSRHVGTAPTGGQGPMELRETSAVFHARPEGKDPVHYASEVLGRVLVSGDVPAMLRCSSDLCLIRLDDPGKIPHAAREIVVTRTALDAHQELLRISESVCRVLQDSGVEAETIRHIASELFKISVEPLVK